MARQASTRLSRRLRGLSASDWLRAAVIGCAALAVALALLSRMLTPTPGQAQRLIGHPAPSFTLRAAQNSQTLAHTDAVGGQSGHPTLLVFFNTLCVHCLAGVQTASAVAQAPGQPPLDVVYVDSPGENAEITGQYMARLRINPPVLLDPGARVASRYGVAYYPTILLLDTQGVVRAVWSSPPSASDIRAAVARLPAAP